MNEHDAAQKAQKLFQHLGKEIGTGPETQIIWAYLAMHIVLWVTWKSAGGEKETALQFAKSFYNRLTGNINFNSDDISGMH